MAKDTLNLGQRYFIRGYEDYPVEIVQMDSVGITLEKRDGTQLRHNRQLFALFVGLGQWILNTETDQ